jgi:signal transduction histidine kinase/ActR/RegA family two-component response regulator
MTLRAQIALLVVAAVLPVVLLAAALTALLERQEDQTLEQGVRETARALALVIARELDVSIAALEAFAASDALDTPDPTLFARQAQRFRPSTHEWTGIALVDGSGLAVFSTVLVPRDSPAPTAAEIELTPKIQTYLERARRERRPIVSDLVSDGTTRRPFIGVVVPVERPGGATSTLMAIVDPLSLVRGVGKDQLRPGWGVRVYDAAGITLAQLPVDPQVVGLGQGPLIATIQETGGSLDQEHWVRLVTRTGTPAYVAYAPVGGRQWGVSIGVPAELVDGPTRRSVLIATGGGLALLLLGVGIAVLTGRRIASPIGRLARAAEAMGRGEPIVLPTSGLTEVRDLASAVRRADEMLRQRAEERERLETELRRRAEALEQASRVKDEFVATVSHELRSPLNAILGWTQILKTGERQQDSTAAKALDTIERNARAQAQLIDDLLDVSRIVAGRLRLDVRPVDVAHVIHSALDVVRPAADAKGIALDVNLVAVRRTVLADPDRLQQVLWNLLSNAVRFTRKGGRVTLTVSTVDSQIEIAVADTGEGISSALLSHLFEPFSQGESAEAGGHKGLGLGLAIVRNLIELQGGRVWAESPGPGGGATFTLSLPLLAVQPSPVTPEGARVMPPDTLAGVKILVTEDQAESRELVATVLEQAGACVTTAASTPEALMAFDREPFDVLVSDVMMPGEDGYSLIRRIRAYPPERGGRMPAVALTAQSRSEDRTRALLAGFQIHIPKPVDVLELITVVATLVGRADLVRNDAPPSAPQSV